MREDAIHTFDLRLPVETAPRWGEPFLLTGMLTTALGQPIGGATIYLQSLRNYGFSVCTLEPGTGVCKAVREYTVPQWIDEITPQEEPLTAQTSKFGSYYFSVNELSPGINQYRTCFLGDGSYCGSISDHKTVTIRKWDVWPTWTSDILSPSVPPLSGCPEGIISAYTNYTIKGRLFYVYGVPTFPSPSLPPLSLNNVPITIKKWQRIWDTPSRYHDVLLSHIKTATDQNSCFLIQQNDASGTYVYVAEFYGNEYCSASESGECVVRVS